MQYFLIWKKIPSMCDKGLNSQFPFYLESHSPPSRRGTVGLLGLAGAHSSTWVPLTGSLPWKASSPLPINAPSLLQNHTEHTCAPSTLVSAVRICLPRQIVSLPRAQSSSCYLLCLLGCYFSINSYCL